MQIRLNRNNENLYCCDCKKNIEIGEKYIEIEEYYRSSIIKKEYCLDCSPTEEDLEEPYICDE